MSLSPSRSEDSLVSMGNHNNAGGGVLHHFEKRWETIHNKSGENGYLAESIGSSISDIVTGVERNHQMLVHLGSNLNALTSNNSIIDSIQSTLDQLVVNVKILEEFLIEKEQMSVKEEMKKSLDLEYHVRIYEGKLRKESHAKMRVAQNDHAQRMRELAKEKARREEEKRKREEEFLRERQKTFSEAFQSEIDQYKKQGVINRPINKSINNPVSASSSAASLSEVVFQVDEEEKRMLEQFLEDEED